MRQQYTECVHDIYCQCRACCSTFGYLYYIADSTIHYYYINFMSRLGNYVRDTAAEMKRVSWPTQKQAVVYTLLVIALSAVVALLLNAFDVVFTRVLDLFFV